jgi:hypothetical protein
MSKYTNAAPNNALQEEDWAEMFGDPTPALTIKCTEFLTLAEAAVLLRRSERTMREWRKVGLLRTHQIGRAKLVYAADLLPMLFGGKPTSKSKHSNELEALSTPSPTQSDN